MSGYRKVAREGALRVQGNGKGDMCECDGGNRMNEVCECKGVGKCVCMCVCVLGGGVLL